MTDTKTIETLQEAEEMYQLRIDSLEAERDSLRATLATQAATIEGLQMELKRHAPISHYDGRDIESWMQEAKTLRKDAAYCQEHHTNKQLCDEQDKTIEGLTAKYHDLIMSVGNKYQGETRHETAKRYIVERESHDPVEASESEATIDAQREGGV